MNDKLLPCPFCGGEAEMHVSEPGKEDRVWVRVCCKDEDCFAHNNNYWYISEQEAIEAWNARAERTCIIESRKIESFGDYLSVCIFKLSCGHEVSNFHDFSFCQHCGAKVVNK